MDQLFEFEEIAAENVLILILANIFGCRGSSLSSLAVRCAVAMLVACRYRYRLPSPIYCYRLGRYRFGYRLSLSLLSLEQSAIAAQLNDNT
jgi:hypothetical protein